jgi:hypothetical protein
MSHCFYALNYLILISRKAIDWSRHYPSPCWDHYEGPTSLLSLFSVLAHYFIQVINFSFAVSLPFSRYWQYSLSEWRSEIETLQWATKRCRVTKGCHADRARLFHEKCLFIATSWWESGIIPPVRNAQISKTYKLNSGRRSHQFLCFRRSNTSRKRETWRSW